MIKFSFIIILLLVLLGCNDENMTFEIGGKYVNVKTNLRYVDTLTVHSYTVRIDSIRTSALTQGSILAGRYSDPEFGDVTSAGYFRIGLPVTRTIRNDAIYDSISLILVHNNYSIGDTLASCTLNLHRLQQTMKVRSDGYFYNTTHFNYDSLTMGSVTYTPRPNTYDTLSISMDSTFGNELFNLLMDEDEKILFLDNFLNYFKGLVLTGDGANNVVVGFKTSESLPVMRLYYHYFDFQNIYKYVDFPINFYNFFQFNQFVLSDPVVDFPTNQKEKVPVQLTDNTSYLQGGTGVVTRFEIPYLRNLLELHENLQVLGAELVLEPVRNTYNNFILPKGLSLYTSDKLNRFGPPIVNPRTGDIEIGKLVIDEVFQEETSYTFDVTNFIQLKIMDASDDIPALLLTIKTQELYKTLDRVVLGSQLHPESNVKLKIYYMHYE